MDVGVIFPQLEIGDDPAVVRDFVQTAEALGYSHVVAFDHVLGAEHDRRDPPLFGPYTTEDMFHEPLTLFAFMAAASSRIGFATGVLVLPQRSAALVAKQAAEVAVLSSGRFRLGVGVGWNYVEFEALGLPFSNRGRRIEEQIEVMRALWDAPVVDYRGAYHRIDRAGISPRPSGGVPVWIGGLGRPAYERAPRLGDGFIFSRFPPETGGAARAVEIGARMRRAVRELGRDEAAFGLEGRLTYGLDPEATRAEIAVYRDGGFDYAAVDMMRAGLAHPRDHLRALEAYAATAGL